MRRARPAAIIASIAALLSCRPAPLEPPAEPADTATDGRELALTRAQIEHGGIRWARSESAAIAGTIAVPGQLAPNEDRTARLSAPLRARVTEVHVRAGDRVLRGQPLVTLQGAEAAAARADYAKAVADLKAHQTAARYARATLDRAERLLELKAMSRQDVERAGVENDEAEAMRAQAEVEVERTRATLMQLGVDPDTGDVVLRAPLAGLVLSRDVVPGSVVDAGAPLVLVTDPTTLWLEIAATEATVPAVRRGAAVTFTVPEHAGETFSAVIENVGAALDRATRTLPVRGAVRNSAGRLRPAMFATVSVTVNEARPGVAVPEGAVQLLDETPVVFVAYPDSRGGARFARRDVEVGARSRGLVHIVRGLEVGEVVVTDGAFAVKSEFARAGSRPS